MLDPIESEYEVVAYRDAGCLIWVLAVIVGLVLVIAGGMAA